MPAMEYKLADEFLPFHPSASHVEPGYRDGWNDCYARTLQRTGLDPEMGFLLEMANKGELAAYDYGCTGMMTALKSILDGQDDGQGIANEPWESLRRRVLELVNNKRS